MCDPATVDATYKLPALPCCHVKEGCDCACGVLGGNSLEWIATHNLAGKRGAASLLSFLDLIFQEVSASLLVLKKKMGAGKKGKAAERV